MIMMTKDDQTLPSAQELTPLSQILISPELANAFSIAFESSKTPEDVLRASQCTITALQQQSLVDFLSPCPSSNYSSANHEKHRQIYPKGAEKGEMEKVGDEEGGGDEGAGDETVGEDVMEASDAAKFTFPVMNMPNLHLEDKILDASHEVGVGISSNAWGASTKKAKRLQVDSADSEGADSERNPGEDRASKRPRLVWTPQLHKRFMDAVAHLGIKNAVPKTIMQLMNVEGLTRENVASHLQKYRLYMKMMQGSTSDTLCSSTPIPPSLAPSAHYFPYSVPMRPMAPVPSGAFGSFEHHPYSAIVQASAQGMTPAEHMRRTVQNQAPASTSSQQECN